MPSILSITYWYYEQDTNDDKSDPLTRWLKVALVNGSQISLGII